MSRLTLSNLCQPVTDTNSSSKLQFQPETQYFQTDAVETQTHFPNSIFMRIEMTSVCMTWTGSHQSKTSFSSVKFGNLGQGW